MITYNICQKRITPACAGSTSYHAASICAIKDHPRLRGEYGVGNRFVDRDMGSPPLARGVLHAVLFLRVV